MLRMRILYNYLLCGVLCVFIFGCGQKSSAEPSSFLYGYDDTPNITNEKIGVPANSDEWGNKRSIKQILEYNDSNYSSQPINREKIKIIRRENSFPEIANYPEYKHEWYRVKDSSVIGCKKGTDPLFYLNDLLPSDNIQDVKRKGGCEEIPRPGRFKVTRFESHEVSGNDYVDFARVQIIEKFTKKPFNIEYVDYKGAASENEIYFELIYYVWRNEIELAE